MHVQFTLHLQQPLTSCYFNANRKRPLSLPEGRRAARQNQASYPLVGAAEAQQLAVGVLLLYGLGLGQPNETIHVQQTGIQAGLFGWIHSIALFLVEDNMSTMPAQAGLRPLPCSHTNTCRAGCFPIRRLPLHAHFARTR